MFYQKGGKNIKTKKDRIKKKKSEKFFLLLLLLFNVFELESKEIVLCKKISANFFFSPLFPLSFFTSRYFIDSPLVLNINYNQNHFKINEYLKLIGFDTYI